jgi:hypothetical protein
MSRLPFYPVPEGSEILFSTVARCTARFGAIGQEAIVRHLTGQRRIQPLLSAIPSYTALIATGVPVGNPLSDPASTIQQHTCLPYFTYFLGREHSESVIAELAEERSAHDVFMMLGLPMYNCGSAPPHPQWCDECNHQSIQQKGVATYRTGHHLPGVATCWIHGSVLCNGCVKCGPNPVRNWGLDLPGRCRCAKQQRANDRDACRGFARKNGCWGRLAPPAWG